MIYRIEDRFWVKAIIVEEVEKSPNNKKHASTQLIIKQEVPQVLPSVSAAASSGKQALVSIHQVKFSGSQPKMAFLEPSCPLPVFEGIEGSQTKKDEAEDAKDVEEEEEEEIPTKSPTM
uniref:Uncharacterized protein n=1 Tax=Cannabis sativa TaxID=3483 RepID=A0A803NI04_CANSA